MCQDFPRLKEPAKEVGGESPRLSLRCELSSGRVQNPVGDSPHGPGFDLLRLD